MRLEETQRLLDIQHSIRPQSGDVWIEIKSRKRINITLVLGVVDGYVIVCKEWRKRYKKWNVKNQMRISKADFKKQHCWHTIEGTFGGFWAHVKPKAGAEAVVNAVLGDDEPCYEYVEHTFPKDA